MELATIDRSVTLSKLQDALYQYQRGDRDFMLANARCINGNPMGLGKTIETLATLEELKPRHCLIVCKKTFIGEWFWQVQEWLGEDCLTPFDGPGDKLAGLDLGGPRYVCVNYDLVGRTKYWKELRRKWDVIVFDEAHKLKNHKTDRTRNTFLLSPYTDRIYLLTGTPMQNSPEDLFPLFHLINPRNYNNHKAWVNMFCVQKEDEIWMKGPDGKPRPRLIRTIVPGETNHVEELNFLLHKYMVRHEKREVMPQLPPKQYRRIPVDLGSEKQQYMQMQEEYFAILESGEKIESPKAIAQLTRLRQICLEPNLMSTTPYNTPSAKTHALMEVLEDIDEKVLIFTVFEQYVRLIEKMLQEAKITYTTITGKKSGFENSANAREFQANPNIKVCLGTIGSMSESFTLNAAKVVIFTDRFWNPAINEQGEDRCWGRVNKGLEQSEGTLIIDLVCEGTVEDHLHEILRRKQQMINDVVIRKAVVERMMQYRR